ncbi:MAG TPA: sulfatase-like hydrolase/transferase, partial [Chitinophagaceae bacterium]|nr:sulfatase-like hydrolase/transferase [Chitinophagaceae bacterium]
YKDFQKAGIASFVMLSVNFFFGSVYSLLKNIPGGSFFTRYSILLPVTALLIIVCLVYIKKSDRIFLRASKYLNILLLLLIIIDSILLIKEASFSARTHNVAKINLQLTKCDSCSKPDIYLLLADEYAGTKQLQDLFSFDNKAFEMELQNRGFFIVKNSRANYNSTVYSIASMLSMDYIGYLKRSNAENHKDILLCRQLIKINSFTHFLENNGYEILNYSFFDIGTEKRAAQNILTTNHTILAGSTLLHRLRYLFGAKLASQQKLDDIKKRELSDNIKIEALLKQSLSEKTTQPKFVYAHFNMPHWPYYFDSAGHETPLEKLTEEFKTDKKAYIEYLKYSNDKLLALIDLIRKKSDRPPIIILMSDHGFRQLPAGTDTEYYFMNMNSIYLPSGDYSGFYEGMSNVNQFRVILNTVFNHQLHMLNDSTTFIKDY